MDCWIVYLMVRLKICLMNFWLVYLMVCFVDCLKVCLMDFWKFYLMVSLMDCWIVYLNVCWIVYLMDCLVNCSKVCLVLINRLLDGLLLVLHCYDWNFCEKSRTRCSNKYLLCSWPRGMQINWDNITRKNYFEKLQISYKKF